MPLDERPRASTLHELLLELRGGYVLHRPILVDVTPAAGEAGPDTTVERTLTLSLPAAAAELGVASELAGCKFTLVGPNTLHGSADAPVTIGRSRKCDVRVENESVSKVHGSIGFDAERGDYVVVDENSRNGTRVNGTTLEPGVPAAVYAGAHLSFGDAVFVFIDPPPLRKLARLAS